MSLFLHQEISIRPIALTVVLTLGTFVTVGLVPQSSDACDRPGYVYGGGYAYGGAPGYYRNWGPAYGAPPPSYQGNWQPAYGAPMYGPPAGRPMPMPNVPPGQPQPGPTIAAHGNQFQPPTMTVPPGTTVRWMNMGRNPHTVTADDKSFDSGDIAAGQSWSHKFDKPGTYKYHCTHHQGMTGTLIVGTPPQGPGGAPAPVPPTGR